MQQRGSLTLSRKTRSIQTPKKDYEGNVYGWETDLEDIGVAVALISATPEEVGALRIATTPGNKKNIHQKLEHLAQIKPIGNSDVKQTAVIGYLVYDLLSYGISDLVVEEICTEYRRTTDKRFFPDHGWFLTAARDRFKSYTLALEQALNPQKPEPERKTEIKPPEMKKLFWQQKPREEWTDEQVQEFVAKHRSWDNFFLSKMLKICRMDHEEFIAIAKEQA